MLVASQKVRTRALFGETSNPNLDITDLTYCILERIGRYGKSNLQTGGVNTYQYAVMLLQYLRIFQDYVVLLYE